ncbi:unnamed protein product [Rotaria sordida]|uniref:Uncharacterized protein n=2 Tax=Rotaria sordida TaxID=392033 RepID=A0A820A4G5_9BILA|nr:unnamed protein product [Rotaria sordida]CAF4180144.1 unnamed protein product [Rotaria sordida]
MTTINITSKEVREKLKGKHVLLIGDSISRGIYKDFACLLSGNDRLLTMDELRYNRHKSYINKLFGETIDCFKTDRANSTKNIEKRKLISNEHDHHLFYSFSSRIWNKEMKKLLLTIKSYDFIIIQSCLWDISRYSDFNGTTYLRNIDICLSKIKQLKKQIIWIMIPPSNSSNNCLFNNLISKLHPSIIEILKNYDCILLDLYDILGNHPDCRHVDGVHFTPNGHRVITYYLMKIISNLLQQEIIIDSVDPIPSHNNLSNDENNPPNDVCESLQQNKNFRVDHYKKRPRSISKYQKKFRPLSRHYTYHAGKYASRANDNSLHVYNKNFCEYQNPPKIITFTEEEPEQFGRAFGAAWKAARQF